jgi:hypothetical protein
MASKRKNSLVNNINRRKRAGKSRPKSRSTVSKDSYQQMQAGWPRARRKSSKKSTKTRATTKSGAKRKTAMTKRKTARKK